MARTAMTIRTRPAPYATTPLDITAMDAFDYTNGMTFPANGATGLVISNPTAGAITLTVHSQPDAQGRSGDINAYSIAAGHLVILQEFPGQGWNTAGLTQVDASATGLLYLAIQRAPGT